MKETTEEWEEECEHCGKETMHRFYCAGHERDGSHNKITCLVCGYWRNGMSDGLHAPFEPLEVGVVGFRRGRYDCIAAGPRIRCLLESFRIWRKEDG